MLLTYKIKHKRDFSNELRKARKVAEYCIKEKARSTAKTPPLQRKPEQRKPLQSSDPSPSSIFSSPSPLPVSPSFASLPDSPADLSPISQIWPNHPPSSSSFTFQYSVKTSTSSKPLSFWDARHIGLKFIISNQILRKYSRNGNIKSVKNVKLIIPRQGIRINKEEKTLWIPSLKLLLNYYFENNFKKISQIEIDSTYAYVAVVFPEQKSEKFGKTGKSEKPENSEKISGSRSFKRIEGFQNPGRYIGVDRNTRGHIAVVADPVSGKVWKLGKMRFHVHRKYENIKKRLEKTGRYRKLKDVRNREKRIVRDLNHKISRKIVDIALETGSAIKLENLKGTRKNKKSNVEKAGLKKITTGNRAENKAKRQQWLYEYSLNSWSFQQLHQFIEYKSRLQGVEVAYIDPHATSKRCSRCGLMGYRHSKQFTCPHCGHVDHADVNASFNIALTPKGSGQFTVERDAVKGSPDTPQAALARVHFRERKANRKTSPQFAWEVCQFLT